MYVSALCNPICFSGNSLSLKGLITAKAPSSHYAISRYISIQLSSKHRHHKPLLASSILLFNVDNNDNEWHQMHVPVLLSFLSPSPILFYGNK